MRTTLDLESTALEAARRLAAHRAQSLGKVVSELILRGLQADANMRSHQGFPVFAAGPSAKPITLNDVQSAEDDA